MGTVVKALSLLDHFDRLQPTIGLSNLARLAGLNKATAYRLLGELAEAGFVEQVPGESDYRLGPAFLRLAALREAAVPMQDFAKQIVQQLADETQETAHMSLMQGERLATVNFAYSGAHGTRVTMQDAKFLSYHATSSGLAVLAFSSPEFSNRALVGPLKKYTPQTVVDPLAIAQTLTDIRKSGVAISVGGFEADVHSHAAPIFDSTMAPIGAIAVASPVTRMTPEKSAQIKELVRQSAAKFTRLTGGFAPADYPKN